MAERAAVEIRYNLFTLKNKLEIVRQRRYSAREIAEKAGLSQKTVERALAGKYRRADFGTLEALLGFFHAEGMAIGIEELLTVTVT